MTPDTATYHLHKDQWNDFLVLSETVAKELWDNKEDEVWNNV